MISIILVCIDGTEYFIGSNIGTYNDGINTCIDDGGILATITNEYEYNVTRELCINNGSHCWIGLNDKYSPGFWRYIDGTSVKGTYGFDINGNPTAGNGPWNANEPNDGGTGEYCVHFKDINGGNDMKWNDLWCHDTKYPLCMRVESQPIKQLITISGYILYIKFDVHRFFISSLESNYTDAIQNCHDFGGILASVTNTQEYNESIMLITNASLNSGFWFALNKLNGVWNYADGSDVRNSLGFDVNGNPRKGVYPWDEGEPNNFGKNEKCGQFRPEAHFKWNDQPCTSELMSLCVKNPPKSCGININNLKVWYKGGLNDISNNGYDAINIKGNIYNDINDCSVYGNRHSSFTIPYNINTTSYTIIYVGKYNGNNKERILTSSNDTNYYAGFWKGKSSGMCYQGGNITDFIDKSDNDWLISTSYPDGCHVNGTNLRNGLDAWQNEFDPGTFNIGVNIYNKHNIKEHSDWKIYEILIFDIILSEYQIKCIENYLSQEHSLPIPSYSIIPTIHPTKTCPPIINRFSDFPTQQPTNMPSVIPTLNPSLYPTEQPTNQPTNQPTHQPSNIPSITPSESPSTSPTNNPTYNPSISPESSNSPSTIPSITPSITPSNTLS